MVFGRKKDKEAEQYQEQLALAAVQGKAQAEAMMPKDQQLDILGRGYFLQEDDKVIELLAEYFPDLIPAYSHLNATSQIKSKKDLKILHLDFQNLLLEEEMELNDDDENYEIKLGLLKSLDIYARFRLFDTWEGYRGRLVTEEIGRTTIVTETRKKKGWL